MGLKYRYFFFYIFLMIFLSNFLLLEPAFSSDAIGSSSVKTVNKNMKICLISFETRDNHLSLRLSKEFSNLNGLKLIVEAIPRDVLDCVEAGAESIIILAHAADFNSLDQTAAPMTFLKELKGNKRISAIHTSLKNLDLAIDEFKLKTRNGVFINSQQAQFYLNAFTLKTEILNLSDEKPIYDFPQIISGHIWQRIIEKPEKLKSIRIATCRPEMVIKFYPELNQLQSVGINIELSSPNQFLSFIFGKSVTIPDYDWIRKSIIEDMTLIN